MAGFKFERDLPHQVKAVESVLKVFDGVSARELEDKTIANISNPIIPNYKKKSNIFDISMETGTGKTYTYTKMMFELNKQLKIAKFIIVVPTLSIKAGTINFLNAKATREHFRGEYNSEIKTYLVESQKNRKNKKSYFPQAIREFVESNSYFNKKIHILIINAGMINSDSMTKNYDVTLLDKFATPFEAILAINPITIIDEPHKFATDNKSWKNIEKFKSQYIFRFGATFDEKEEFSDKHKSIITLFAYVIKNKNGSKNLNLIVETKDKEKRALFKDEKQKIRHAQELFNSFNEDIKIEFKTQFESEKIVELIKELIPQKANQ